MINFRGLVNDPEIIDAVKATYIIATFGVIGRRRDVIDQLQLQWKSIAKRQPRWLCFKLV